MITDQSQDALFDDAMQSMRFDKEACKPAFTKWPNMIKYVKNLDTFEALQNVRILIIGAGGLGCELLKCLAYSGFKELDIIDMDTVDLSNLNRQFLFRNNDIGKPKAEVAAEFIRKRISNISITPHVCRIEDKDASFYSQFCIIVCGLDSLIARRWINSMVHSLVVYDEDGKVDPVSVIPLIDGGTEGFNGSVRVIIPTETSCLECNLDLFAAQINYPMCTLANTPRLPEHCIEYVKAVTWNQELPFGSLHVDGDDPDHVQWIYEKSLERANHFKISGVTRRLTLGVIKHIIPAVASTNVMIAAQCALEVLNLCTRGRQGSLFSSLTSVNGLSVFGFDPEKRSDCLVCGRTQKKVHFSFQRTLEEFIEYLKMNENFQMKDPSLTADTNGRNITLYMPSVESLKKATEKNLQVKLQDLGITNSSTIYVTDATYIQPVSISICEETADH